MKPNPLMEQLHDIEGLDAISHWPLAIGWWVLIALGAILTIAITYGIVHRITFKRSWKNDALRKLDGLEANLTESTARETVITLSEYLRRIALRRFPRNECAGLAGEDWLKWLSMHDPKQVDWEKKGALLIEVPYSPLNKSLPIREIKELIQAVRGWVR